MSAVNSSQAGVMEVWSDVLFSDSSYSKCPNWEAKHTTNQGDSSPASTSEHCSAAAWGCSGSQGELHVKAHPAKR